MTAPQDPKRSDALVDLYREASAQDAGPSAASTAQILAHARAKAAQNPVTPADLDSSGQQGQHFEGEAANDRRWWLQALGSLAAIGLVSWLALQHLHEPGAPQLEAPQMDSAPSAASAPPPPPAAPVAAAADRAASPDSAKMRSEAAPMGKAANPAADAAPPPLPASAAGAGMGSANTRPSPTIAPAPQAERRMPPAVAPTPVAPPMPAPAAAAVAPAARKQAAERPAAPMAAAPAASEAGSALAAAPTLLPCGPDLDAQALAEQRRRIQAYDKAMAAGLPAPAPVPLCRPAPAHEAEPAQPVDSR
ncbi:hypothetical protein [Comamonas sp. JUb58]|uniref:hypothetical protein n=1 Tax=Comamonas sp. JUb58 TaxID=2485114 RepID=UPI00105D8EBC|nr:hypothetical protein [Comamonas sp. JUb58]TDS68868.1 hypothetical protein EDF71_1386 [Comamonas sp. JUb58]